MIPDRLTTALADRYRIGREPAQGGMATVYLAEDLKPRRPARPELAVVIGDEHRKEVATGVSLKGRD